MATPGGKGLELVQNRPFYLAGPIFKKWPEPLNPDTEAGRRVHDEAFPLFSTEYNRIKRYKTQRDSAGSGDANLDHGTPAKAEASAKAEEGASTATTASTASTAKP